MSSMIKMKSAHDAKISLLDESEPVAVLAITVGISRAVGRFAAPSGSVSSAALPAVVRCQRSPVVSNRQSSHGECVLASSTAESATSANIFEMGVGVCSVPSQVSVDLTECMSGDGSDSLRVLLSKERLSGCC